MFHKRKTKTLTVTIKIFFMLLITNVVVFVKVMLQGYLLTQVVVGIVSTLSLALFIYAASTKTIALSMLDDSEQDYDPSYSVSWWNFYKHPLTVMAQSSLDLLETQNCTFSSRSLRRGRRQQLLVPEGHEESLEVCKLVPPRVDHRGLTEEGVASLPYATGR